MSDRESELRAWARSDDVERRYNAADADDLPLDLMRELLRDPGKQVVTGLISNYAVPREILDEARTLHPEHAEWVALHPNAPFDLAEAVPLWKHTYLSITSYCEARGLGEAIRDRVAMARTDAEPFVDGITLAEAVEAAR